MDEMSAKTGITFPSDSLDKKKTTSASCSILPDSLKSDNLGFPPLASMALES